MIIMLPGPIIRDKNISPDLKNITKQNKNVNFGIIRLLLYKIRKNFRPIGNNEKQNYNIIVNYETQWTYVHLGPKNSLFAPQTLIREMVPVLQEHIKRFYPDRKFNSQEGTSTVSNFNLLYRNVSPTFKGWQISYRRPGSDGPFGLIPERIGHKSQPKHFPLKPPLQRSMRWTHQKYSYLEPVVLEPVSDCAVMARRLNQQVIWPSRNRPPMNMFMGEGCGTS